jgi:hypothetical protein
MHGARRATRDRPKLQPHSFVTNVVPLVRYAVELIKRRGGVGEGEKGLGSKETLVSFGGRLPSGTYLAGSEATLGPKALGYGACG